MVYKAEDEGIYGLTAVVPQYEVCAFRHAYRPEIVPIPILFVGLENGFVPQACGQDMAFAGDLVEPDIFIFQRNIECVCIGWDRVGLLLIIDKFLCVLSMDLIEVFELEVAVGVLIIDVQGACLDLDMVSGQAAETMCHQGEAAFG